MKRFLFAFLSIILCANLQSQNYHEDDKEGLRRILRQPSAVSGTSNLECAGLTAADTANWKTNEDWVLALQNRINRTAVDWEWSLNKP
ncbi:MAG: hypothetical protein LBR34_08810, partial [Prevotella sp.]|nr:hypothetical protein [Prevotella sp.]